MGKNFSRYVQAFQNREVDLEFDPPALYVETVAGCPHSCAMCTCGNSKPTRLSAALLKTLEPHFHGLEVMSIHGDGEPLLSDVDYFAGVAAQNDCVLHMNTTGFLLTKRISDRLLEARVSIRFSIHAGKHETYRKIMGRELNQVAENVSYLVRKAEDIHSDSDFWFSFIVMKENAGEVEDFLKLAHRCGIRAVRFMRLRPNWQSVRGVHLPDRDFTFRYFEQFNQHVRDQFIKKLPQYRELSAKLGIKVEFGTFFSDGEDGRAVRGAINAATSRWLGKGLFPLFRSRGACMAPWFGQLRVSQTGDVKLCCATDYSVGNLTRSTLPEIWNSDKMKRIREVFRTGHIPRICGYCRGFLLDNYPRNSFTEIRDDLTG
jgi:MoaA/NifB/PqqE/SkfB family radical SAM enzyme